MAGLTIKCPKCSQKMAIRSSRPLSEFTTEGFVRCDECSIRGTVRAELQSVKIAEFKPFHSTNTQKEQNIETKRNAFEEAKKQGAKTTEHRFVC